MDTNCNQDDALGGYVSWHGALWRIRGRTVQSGRGGNQGSRTLSHFQPRLVISLHTQMGGALFSGESSIAVKASPVLSGHA